MSWALAQDGSSPFIVEVHNKQPSAFLGTHYLLVNHSSSKWDFNSDSALATKRLLALTRAEHPEFKNLLLVDTASLSDPKLAAQYFATSADVDHTIEAYSGTHQLKFPKTRVFAFAGGYLMQCLCEAIRDSVRGAGDEVRRLDLLLVADAIYENAPMASRGFFSRPAPGKTFTLEKLFENLSDVEISEYLKYNLTGKKFWCPWQDFSDKPLSSEDYSFKLLRDGRPMSSWGEGKKQITVTLTNVDHFSQDLLDLEASRESAPIRALGPAPKQKQKLLPVKSLTK